MRVLLTNDDGVEAEGLRLLREEMIQAGISVVTVAPDGNRSGHARACTYRTPVAVTTLTAGEHPVFACDGTPIDCVRVGLLTQIAAEVDLIITGINHGANLGDDVTYSGTVGAGIEAALLGFRSVCFSQQSLDARFRFVESQPTERGHEYVSGGQEFTRSSRMAARMTLSLLSEPAPPATVLNVNFPSRLESPAIELTKLGRRFFDPGSVQPVSSTGSQASYYLFGTVDDDDPRYEDAPGTDFAAVGAGKVSVTPLTIDWGFPIEQEDGAEWLLALGRSAQEASRY